MKKTGLILRYPVAILFFAAGAFIKNTAGDLPGAILFLLLGGGLSLLIYREEKNILDLRLLLTLSWFLCLSLSCLKLSALQTEWGVVLWTALGVFYFLFNAGYDLMTLLSEKRSARKEKTADKKNPAAERSAWPAGNITHTHIFFAILIVAFLGLSCFLIECIKFHFEIPLFVRGVPHSYTSFHISGLHYFVVSVMFVHPLSVLYFMEKKEGKRYLGLLLPLNVLCFLIPVFLLSKLQILIALALPIITWLLLKRVPLKKILPVLLSALLVLVAGFVVIVLSRDYPEGYLQEVFQFKKPETPLVIQYPFIYAVINFENLNRLVENKTCLTWGTRELYPFFCLTGLKFKPEIQQIIYKEIYLVSGELTTRSILYDAYGDFGIVGAGVLGLLSGAFSAFAAFRTLTRKTVGGILLYGQLAVYMVLSFFTSWFSNPTTWFWFAATLAIDIFCRKKTLWFFGKRGIKNDS